MTDPDRVVVWLRETMDAAQEDAEAARDAHRGVYASEGDAEWYFNATDGVFTKPHGIQVTPGVPYVDPDVEPHIARQSPAAVLRRIAADRKQLGLHENVDGKCDECGRGYELSDWGPDFPCATVRLLAEGWGWTEETT